MSKGLQNYNTRAVLFFHPTRVVTVSVNARAAAAETSGAAAPPIVGLALVYIRPLVVVSPLPSVGREDRVIAFTSAGAARDLCAKTKNKQL